MSARVARAGAMLAAALAGVAATAAPPVPAGTSVRLMVLDEVSTHTAKAGMRFPLLVDEAVRVDGEIVIPLQTKAWGEVVEAHENGSAGTSGRLAARLLWIDAPGGRVPLRGELAASGSKAFVQTGVVALAAGVFAPLALLARGNNARLRAGDIVQGVVAAPAEAHPEP